MNPNRTEIIALMDRSGSMTSLKFAMEEAWKKFITDQRSAPGECYVTLAMFDTEYNVAYEGRDVQTEPEFVLEPRGMTALLDAMCKTIDEQGKRLARLPEENRPGKVIFLVFTDGLENSSREFKTSDVHARVKHQESKYNWQFVYMGAHLDAFDQAMTLGIDPRHSMRSGFTAASVGQGMSLVSRQTVSYRADPNAKTLGDTHADLDDEGKDKTQ